MKKLSKYEKETIINWNEAEDTASIYTFNADLKRRLAEFSRKYPQLCRLERSTTEGSVIYVTILASEDRSKELRQRRPSVRRQLKQEPHPAEKGEKKAPARKKTEPER